MKYFFVFFTILFLAGCAENSSPEKKTQAVKKKHDPVPQIPVHINYSILDSSIKDEVRRLDSIYGRTPYYAIVQNKKMFIVLKGKFDPDSAYYLDKFKGRFKYGIVDDHLRSLLNCAYDKIYNPNLTMVNCVEIKKGGETGLFNFVNSEIIEPQFDFITPSGQVPGNIAFGFKSGNWYKIENNIHFKISKSDFLPIELLKTLSFNVQDKKDDFFYNSYVTDEEGPSFGMGVVFAPSFIEHLNIVPEICEDIIVQGQKNLDWGTQDLKVKTEAVISNSDNLTSFIYSFYYEGISGRGYKDESNKVVVYNNEKRLFSSDLLDFKYQGYDNICHPRGYKFINDTVIEILQGIRTDTTMKSRYDFENVYSYKRITKDGSITDMHCNRYYSFTKYFEIQSSYFEGCYALHMNEEESTDSSNTWITDHLSIDDLDLMVNEIYADHGFKFKTEKWKKYFSRFAWYHPEFENIEDKLTATDRKNILLITNEKTKMKGRENEFTKKRKILYMAAG